MMQPPSRKMVSKTTSIPAPVGGLNARDSIANMPPEDASILENMFPQTTSVDIRNGYSIWQTGLPGWAETVMAYNAGTTSKLFAIAVNGAGANIYDVTTKGGTPSSVVSGLANARWQFTNFATVAGWFLYACNGTDYPQVYNGTTWQQVTGISTPFALTGTDLITGGAIDPRTLICPTTQVQRLWFVQKGTAVVYYLPVSSLGGTLNGLNLQPWLKMGGSIISMVSWTIDNIAGINNYTAFISSMGDVIVFSGTDPSSASTWSLLAYFKIGPPVGSRPFCRVAGDVAVITSDGLTPLTKALMFDRDAQREAITDKIQNAVNADVASYGANFGWQVIDYPQGKKLFVNVPYQTDANIYQYVMNTLTKAWCKFTGWNAACWETQGNNLFFGGNGNVCLADVGQSDNGANIVGLARQAFNYFGMAGYNIIVTLIRPIFLTSGSVIPVIAINADFNTVQPTATPSYLNFGTAWNTVLWDTSPWSSPSNTQANWMTSGGEGKALTAYMKIASANQSVQWQATDWLYNPGAIL